MSGSTARVVHVQLADGSGRRAVEEANALAGQGLEGDKHARPTNRRQVLLVEQEVLEAFSLAPGALTSRSPWPGCDWLPCLRAAACRWVRRCWS